MTRNIPAALALIAAGFAALPAAAASMGDNERPDLRRAMTQDARSKDVRAGEIYSSAELTRLDIDADAILSVTLLPSNGKMDRSSSGDM